MTDRSTGTHRRAMGAALATDLTARNGQYASPLRCASGLARDADRRDGAGLHRSEGSGAFIRPTFETVYERWFDFVWRSVRRLGVPEASVDDAVQDVFVVVHRKLDGFEGRSTVKTWLFGIAMRVASDHRRARKRRPVEPLRESLVDAPNACPMESCARKEAVELLHSLLEELDDDKRAVFVMAELEQMSAPEIASTLGVKLNTVYSRLRAARASFELAVQRHRARERSRARGLDAEQQQPSESAVRRIVPLRNGGGS